MDQLILFFLIMTTAVLGKEIPTPLNLQPEEKPEILLKLMETTYVTGRPRTGPGAGEPLLLTPLIESNNLDEARKAAKVDSDYLLPDMDSYAGYFTVNKKYNANLWFWYFPVMDQPIESTPWIIWLQGGPGASSLYGLFTEIGPFFVTDNQTLEEMQYSWGKNHSLLFIDNPVGTGFSFTDDDSGYATNQTTIGENLYCALQQFLKVFPELREAPLTIAGESYAGKHIPSLAIQIHWHRDQDEPINLHGLAIGNGMMDPQSLQRYSYFVREVGLVDDSVADTMKCLEDAAVEFIKKGDMMRAYLLYNTLLKLFETNSKQYNFYNYLKGNTSLDGPYINYIQKTNVRRALHVGNTTFTSLEKIYRKLIPDFMRSVKSWIEELIDNYKVLCYNGHLDIIVAYHPSVNTYNSFNHSFSAEYKKAKRMPWYHNEQLAGYYKIGGNFTDLMIRGAGHMVPTDKPSAALGMISAFARGIPLDRDTCFLIDIEQKIPRRRNLIFPESS